MPLQPNSDWYRVHVPHFRAEMSRGIVVMQMAHQEGFVSDMAGGKGDIV